MANENLILIEQFCSHHQVSFSFIETLQQNGLISLLEIGNSQYVSPEDISQLEKMMHLHYDLGINVEGIDAIGHLLQQIETLQQQMQILHNKLQCYQTIKE